MPGLTILPFHRTTLWPTPQTRPAAADVQTLLMASSNPANGPVTLQQEGGDGAERMEREAMQRSHSQLPYFLGKPSQEHTVIKSGYCVKQGAVVSSHPVLFVWTGRRPHQGLLSSCVEDVIEEGSLGAV